MLLCTLHQTQTSDRFAQLLIGSGRRRRACARVRERSEERACAIVAANGCVVLQMHARVYFAQHIDIRNVYLCVYIWSTHAHKFYERGTHAVLYIYIHFN